MTSLIVDVSKGPRMEHWTWVEKATVNPQKGYALQLGTEGMSIAPWKGREVRIRCTGRGIRLLSKNKEQEIEQVRFLGDRPGEICLISDQVPDGEWFPVTGTITLEAI